MTALARRLSHNVDISHSCVFLGSSREPWTAVSHRASLALRKPHFGFPLTTLSKIASRLFSCTIGVDTPSLLLFNWPQIEVDQVCSEGGAASLGGGIPLLRTP